MDQNIRVRYAPSPTGPQHIGGIRTALYNYLFAKKHGGAFILRIEDTDQTRYVEGAEEYILESVKWCGFQFDEGVNIGGKYGPYRQSERKHIYRQFVQQLLDQGKAYYAFDSPEELSEIRTALEQKKKSFKYDSSTRLSLKNSLSMEASEVEDLLAKGEPYTVRLAVPADTNIAVDDLVRGKVVINSRELDDKVIFKSDGLPTYHLANVVDDYLMKITHVIRGEEWLPSAPFHVLLYDYLGWKDQMPAFAHLPLLLKPNGNGKLSKRDGDAMGFPVFPLQWTNPKTKEQSSRYREAGYLPEAFLNILAFLGWNPGTEQELFNLDELIASFSLERVVKSGAKFDPEKAKWFNQQYLVQKTGKEISQLMISLDKSLQNVQNLDKIGDLMKERVHFASEIMEKGSYFFEKPADFDQKVVKKKWKEDSVAVVKQLRSLFDAQVDFQATALEQVFKEYVEGEAIPFGLAMISLRLCLTGQGGGPNLFEIMDVLGKTETIRRLDECPALIDAIKASA